MFGYEWKSGGMEKMSLNKFTYIPLLKNDAKFKKKKKKVTNNHTKKSNHANFFIKIKNMFQKKITSSKNKNKLSCLSPKKSKEKKLEKKRGNVNAQGKKKSDNWQHDYLEKEKRKKKQKNGQLVMLLPTKKIKKQLCYLGEREERKKYNLK